MYSSRSRRWKSPLRRVLVLVLSATMFGVSLSARAAQQDEDCPPNITFAEDSAASPYAGSYALLISVSAYRFWKPLPNVRNHIDNLAKVLRCKGFDITPVTDPTGDELRSGIRSFIRKYGASPKYKNNRLLVYYSGHGYAVTDTEDYSTQGYIVPTDAPNPGFGSGRNEIDFTFTAVNLDELIIEAKRIKAKHSIFLIDACLSGSLFESTISDFGQVPLKTPPGKKVDKRVVQFITAGNAYQEVRDDGLFKDEFIKAVTTTIADDDADGILTGSQLGDFLHHRIHNRTKSLQSPQFAKLKASLVSTGEFLFRVPSEARK